MQAYECVSAAEGLIHICCVYIYIYIYTHTHRVKWDMNESTHVKKKSWN